MITTRRRRLCDEASSIPRDHKRKSSLIIASWPKLIDKLTGNVYGSYLLDAFAEYK